MMHRDNETYKIKLFLQSTRQKQEKAIEILAFMTTIITLQALAQSVVMTLLSSFQFIEVH